MLHENNKKNHTLLFTENQNKKKRSHSQTPPPPSSTFLSKNLNFFSKTRFSSPTSSTLLGQQNRFDPTAYQRQKKRMEILKKLKSGSSGAWKGSGVNFLNSNSNLKNVDLKKNSKKSKVECGYMSATSQVFFFLI
jgi:hypothetical protein